MQSNQSKSSPITISKVSKFLRLLLLMMVMLLCSCAAVPCPVCPDSRITLQVEQPPALREIQAVKRGNEYCLDERGRKNLLIDIEIMRGWCVANQAIIEEFNKRGAPEK